MARSKADIKKQMTDLFIQNETVQLGYGLDITKTFEQEFSTVSVENILFEIFAFCAYWLESLFDIFRNDVETALYNRTPHTLTWYANKLKDYMHGLSLPADSDKYDITGLTEEQVQEAKVVRQSAVTEHPNQNGTIYLRMKAATDDGDDLAPLSAEQLNGLKEYVKRIKDAGIKVEVESNEPDRIKMSWKVYYDPLVLDEQGSRLDGTAKDVVKTAIKEHLKQISFNGVYAIQKHEDYVQKIEGVVLCPVQYAQSAYGNYEWTTINELIVPDAGYMRFAAEEDLTINYIPFKN